MSSKISMECLSARDICLLREDHFRAVEIAGQPRQEITKQKDTCRKIREAHKTNEISKEGHPPVIA